jgi:hypothetical protein
LQNWEFIGMMRVQNTLPSCAATATISEPQIIRMINAMLISREQAVQAEFERLKSAQLKRLKSGATVHRIHRVFIRAFRIAAGIALIILASYSCSTANGKTDIPFASLTLADIGVVLIGYAIAVALAVWSFRVALGAPPQISRTSDKDLRAEAEGRIAMREQQEISRAAREAQEEQLIAKRYERSKLMGLLSDPGLSKRHKWLPWVAVPLAYIIPTLIVRFLS